MSWIKIEHGLCKSRKIAKLSSAMGWSRHQAIGFMVDFWIWAAQSCDDGQLKDITDSEIAFAGGLEQAKGILAALVASGFVDQEPLRIHQWAEHQAEFLRSKYRRNPGQHQKIQDLYRACTEPVPVLSRNKQASKQDKQYKQDGGVIGGETPATPEPKLKPEIPVEPAPEPEAGVLAACQKIKNISPAMLASWRSTYPSLDIVKEIQKADCWAVANQKVCSRWGRFVNNWLKNAQKGPKDTGHGKDAENATGGNLDALAVALTECWLENQTGKAPDKATAEATCKLYYNDIKMYLDLWRGDMDGAAAFLAEFSQEKRKQGYNRWPMSWATKAAALKVAEKEAGR